MKTLDVTQEFKRNRRHIIMGDESITSKIDYHGHPRPHHDKTHKEHKANPNKERDRKARQWQRAVESHKWCGSLRHKA